MKVTALIALVFAAAAAHAAVLDVNRETCREACGGVRRVCEDRERSERDHRGDRDWDHRGDRDRDHDRDHRGGGDRDHDRDHRGGDRDRDRDHRGNRPQTVGSEQDLQNKLSECGHEYGELATHRVPRSREHLFGAQG